MSKARIEIYRKDELVAIWPIGRDADNTVSACCIIANDSEWSITVFYN